MAAIPTILKGDDSGAITITLDSSHTYTGATLVVAYQGVTRTYTDLVAGGTVSLAFTHDETAAMTVKTAPILMRLIGATGGEETVENADARIKVTDCIAEVNAGGSFTVAPGSAFVPQTDVGDVAERYTVAQLAAKVNEIVHVLAQRSLLALGGVALLAGGAMADITTQTARLDALYNDSLVVTNVSGAATDPGVVSNIVEGYGFAYPTVTNGLASVEYVDAHLPSDYTTTNAVCNLVTNNVAPWAMAGKAEPQGMTTNAVREIVAYKRDLTNNVCAADSFTAWGATPPSGYTFGDAQPVFNSTTEKWTWYVEGPSVAVDAESGASTAGATSATFTFDDSGTKTFTATRARAALSNDIFTTYGFVTNAVASATPDFTTNNPAFVKGVTNVVDAVVLEMVANSANTNAVAILNETLGKDWTTYGGGLAGLLAAILAALAVLKKGKANVSDFTIGSFASYVASLFSSVDTSTDPAASGLLNNATLDKGIVKVCNSIVGTPNATLATALGTAAS